VDMYLTNHRLALGQAVAAGQRVLRGPGRGSFAGTGLLSVWSAACVHAQWRMSSPAALTVLSSMSFHLLQSNSVFAGVVMRCQRCLLHMRSVSSAAHCLCPGHLLVSSH
jgi:hypothetical protein